jgi:signal transduction histidine kinase
MSEVSAMTTFATPLKRVFLNLLGNTLKHHHQPEQARVVVRIVEKTGYYACEVEDNGPGIPEGQTERVFGMFQTLHSATSRSLSGERVRFFVLSGLCCK